MYLINRRVLRGTCAALLLALGAGLTATAAHADFGVRSFETPVTNAAGGESQAGGHPESAAAHFQLTERVDPDTGGSFPDGAFKDVVVDIPPGLVGNPRAVSTCSRLDLAAAACSPSSQVGVVQLDAAAESGPGTASSTTYGLYNVVPEKGAVATFAFVVTGAPVYIKAVVPNKPDHAVQTVVRNASQALRTAGVNVVLWGVPADPIHTPQRGAAYFCFGTAVDCSEPGFPTSYQGGEPSGLPPTPFLTHPTACGGGSLTTHIAMTSWEAPTTWKLASATSAAPVNCDAVPFDPSISARPTTTAPDAPTGLTVQLAFPQEGLLSQAGVATGHLKDAVVTLPEGLTINPASADGLEACSDEQLHLLTDDPVTCPAGAKIGTVTATTPLLGEPVQGSVYLRPQASDDPASGDMFRLAVVIEDSDRGISVRLPGSVKVNPDTGRIVTEFADNPQLPVSTLSLKLKTGPRAPLATPAACGPVRVGARLTAWSGQIVDRGDDSSIDCAAGLGGFAPTFEAGTTNPLGGALSTFALRVGKPDGNAAINGLTMTLPAGLLAKLKGNVGTQVGGVKAFAGPGSSPYMLPGKVFLEGPYGDAPFSLRVVVPAKAGPFDLGDVVVRQKVYVDPISAQVTVVSDPVPTIVKGVPARLQRLEVSVDKPDFIINPTSCAPKVVAGVLRAQGGGSAAVENRFQVSECSTLALEPSLGLTLSGKGQTTDGGHPAVSAVLSQPSGRQVANLKKVRVALPLSLALDPDNAASDDLCSFAEGSKPDPRCPASSVVGRATAVSPILNEPLTGPVYFVKNERKDPKSGRSIKTTPKLVIPLTGENGVKLTLTGTSTVADDQLVTTFDNIPDAPVSSFKMDIAGGKKGILVVSAADICKSTQIADQQVDGQNSKQADGDVFIQTPSCPLKVLSKKVGKRNVVVKVGGLGAGKVTLTGKGIRKTTKVITKSTVATITAKRSKGTPGKVTVAFDPAGPAKVRKINK